MHVCLCFCAYLFGCPLEKAVSDPLELKLQKAVSILHEVSGN